MGTALRFPGMLYRLSSVPAERKQPLCGFPYHVWLESLRTRSNTGNTATGLSCCCPASLTVRPSGSAESEERQVVHAFFQSLSFLLSRFPTQSANDSKTSIHLEISKMSELARGSSWEREREGGRRDRKGERERARQLEGVAFPLL